MGLKVTPEHVLDAAQFIDTASDDLIDHHHRVTQHIDSLFEKGWTGPAAEAYRKAWDEWNRGFREVIIGLKKETYALRSAASGFTNTDTSSATNIQDAERNL